MLYVNNAFSLNMLDTSIVSFAIQIERLTQDLAMKILDQSFVSVVGHEGFAKLYSSIFHADIKFNRLTVKLSASDQVLVGQYSGPRLPEGATSLPEGAVIEWMLVSIS